MIYRELQELNPYVRICVRTVADADWALCGRIIYDHQFVLVSKGKGTVLLGEQHRTASKGDLFLIKPGMVHGFIADKEDPFEMLVIHFDFFYEKDRNFWPHKKYHLSEGESEADLPDKYLLREVPVFDGNMSFPDYLKLQDYTQAEILMRKLIDLSEAVMPGKELLVKSVFLEFLYLVWSQMKGGLQKERTDGFEKIRKAYEYMNEHYMDELKLDQLAALCSLSTNYFSALFKKQTSYSPKEYLLRVRIEKARALLVQSEATITEVGERVGFHDIHYFSFYFKKFQGVSPSQYRAALQGAEARRTEC